MLSFIRKEIRLTTRPPDAGTAWGRTDPYPRAVPQLIQISLAREDSLWDASMRTRPSHINGTFPTPPTEGKFSTIEFLGA
jgi:hypothetical protein